MSGWSLIVPTRGRHHHQGARQRHARPRAGRTSRPARRLHRVLRRASEDQPPLRGAEHRGRRLGGRPTEDGVSGTVSVCQGDVRNASIEGIELKCPVLVESRALRTNSGGPGKHPRRARHRHLRAQPGRGPLEFRSSAPRTMSAVGDLGWQGRHDRRFSAADAGRERLPLHGRDPLPGAG